jgi:hypothetical protein
VTKVAYLVLPSVLLIKKSAIYIAIKKSFDSKKGLVDP